ncbi:hypothetical protein TVAG_193810 [Trichomonas vaginalis G3]|uniref:Uncharacterized protein n=1 Tax=Trichomonas vaginalis (strain ATCC PRA-98 / G3) TaxID=412133 RepID=A2EVN1_TRIV3|nr:hypothetical protein TVAGG3_0358200 [Trichomonas vaginalis G3]EAY03310.1 hypothetical protein TVAG_193810 [Trichomonas vaginalis G3]KAI5531764.1 hypothetical protein TVAGG3_0358200 [Trichomonas vaginalis G3]|eukprot:XP_001315533.1 hypothetical protein [Trichomonas vaginalis G3]
MGLFLSDAAEVILKKLIAKQEEIKELQQKLKELQEENSKTVEQNLVLDNHPKNTGIPVALCAMYSKYPNCMLILDICVLQRKISKVKEELSRIDFNDEEYEEISSLNKKLLRLQHEKEDALQVKKDYENELEELKKNYEEEKGKLRKEIANYSQ